MQILNKKAKFNYFLLEFFEAGIVLAGSEAKALRTSGGDINNAYVKIIDGQLWLVNASIPIAGKLDYNPTRSRKLLMHKSEIVSLESKIKAKNLILVPAKLYNKGRLVKVSVAIAKSKRKFEKKESIKKRDLERELALNKYQ